MRTRVHFVVVFRARILPRNMKRFPLKVAGAASLRSNAQQVSTGSAKKGEDLDKHGKILWDWLEVDRKSRIRMLMMWQAGSGVSFVATCHHRVAQCFKYHGNSKGDIQGLGVSLQEWQAAIKRRHAQGSSGIDGEAEQFQSDWQ